MIPGDNYPVFDLDFARIGVQTCYDGYFPEPARTMALQGAELVIWINGRPGGAEAYLAEAAVFQSVVHMAVTNQALGYGTMLVANIPSAGLMGTPHVLNATTAPGEAHLTGTFDLHALRLQRKHSRMFHQRRPSLAAPIAEAWQTAEFYAAYPDDHAP